GGDAATLYRSIQRLLALPAATRLYMCHDYPPTARPVQWVCSVAEQKAHNIHVNDGISATAFVAMRNARDRTLEMPVLILPAIQINLRAGEPPPAENDGQHYLKIPLNRL
ncbi:MAG: MBL fold metallo-hydrolase, partial [bacterium]